MGFNFGVDIDVEHKHQSKINNNICITSKHTNNSSHVLFLLDTFPRSVSSLKYFMDTMIRQYLPGFDYDVVVASKLNYTTEQIQKYGIYKYYQDYSSDFMPYVQDTTVIVTLGYSLQAITMADDLSIGCFYDYIFNKTFFYSGRTHTHIFPVDAIAIILDYSEGKYMPQDCSRFEFFKLQLNYIKNHYESLSNPPARKRFKIVQLENKSDWKEFINIGSKYKKISWDIETDGLNYYRNNVGCITASFDGIIGYYAPWKIVDIEDFNRLIKDKYQIGANKKFDDKFLKHRGLTNAYTHSDVLQLGHLLNETRFNGLKSLAYYYTQYGGYDYDLDQYIRHFKPRNYLEIPILPSYAAQDAIHTFNVEAMMQQQLTKMDIDFKPRHPEGWSIRDFYEKVVMPYQNIFIDIELNGINVDMDIWNHNASILEGDILSLQEELRSKLMIVSNDDILISFDNNEDTIEEHKELQSGKKLGEILENLGWENLGITKGGWYKTGDDQLLRWSQLGHGEAHVIQKLRSYLTLQKTFMGTAKGEKGWRPHVIEHGKKDTRIHPTYGTMLTDTYRNNCHDPNYQQIPSTSKNLGDKIESFKRIFTVSDIKNKYLVTCDLASAQIRLATIDSQDKTLYKAYLENPNVDIHSKTGYNIFCRDSLFTVDEIVVEHNGKNKVFFPHEKIRVIRNGQEIEIKAIDLQESDSLI